MIKVDYSKTGILEEEIKQFQGEIDTNSNQRWLKSQFPQNILHAKTNVTRLHK